MSPLPIVLYLFLLVDLLLILIWLLGHTSLAKFSLRVLKGFNFGRFNQFGLKLRLLIDELRFERLTEL